MPRNITVTLANGKTHTYANAPDDITPEAVTQRAQKDFGQPVTALDGGRKAPSTQAQSDRAPANPYLDRWKNIAPARAKELLQEYDGKISYTSPRVQALRQIAGMPAIRTRNEEIKSYAKSVVQGNKARRSDLIPDALEDFGASAQASFADWLPFDAANRIGAGINYYTGIGKGKSYSDELNIQRAINAETRARSDTGNVLGGLLGALGGGALATNIARTGASALARSTSPIVARAGNTLQRVQTLQRGATTSNAAKLAAGGAVTGAVDATLEGSAQGNLDAGAVADSAVFGAVAAPVLGAALAGASRGVDAIRRATGNLPASIRSVVREKPEAIAARQQALSNEIGAPAPIIAALDDADFRSVSRKIVGQSPEAADAAKAQGGKYIRGFMDRMLAHVNRAGDNSTVNNAAWAGSTKATTIGDLAQLRKDTSDELMRPIENQTLNLSKLPLDDLEKDLTRKVGGRIVGLADRIKTALGSTKIDGLDASADDIRKALELLEQYGLASPVNVTVREMDSLRRSLDSAAKSLASSNPIDSMALRNAATTVKDFVASSVPGYGKMVNVSAGHARMIEGFETAAAGIRLGDIEDTVLRNNVQSVEGRVGMRAGELFRLREAATKRPTSAITLSRDLAAEGSLTRPASLATDAARPGSVTENIGDRSAKQLTQAAKAENTALDRMLDTQKTNTMLQEEQGALSPETIIRGAFLGDALATTKAQFLSKLFSRLNNSIKPETGVKITNMLYSQEPEDVAKALRALRRTGVSMDDINAAVREAAATNLVGEANRQPETDPYAAQEPETDPYAAQEPETDPYAAQDSPYAEQLAQVYESTSPEVLDLIDRVIMQESGGRQTDEAGNPVTSSAGAIGAMQLMPATAPEAAALAGVEFDEQAYMYDPAYNRLLGTAYLMEMLRRFDGDVPRALAAYNAGPAAVARAENYGDDWLSALPAETQDYVRKIT